MPAVSSSSAARSAAAAGLLLGLAACAAADAREPAAAPTAAPRPVRVAAIGDTTAAATVEAAGTLTPRDALPLAF